MNRVELLNMDCMVFMKNCPDNAFDLAIVDPPYFKGSGDPEYYNSHLATATHKPIFDTWEVPGRDYFNELFRVSKNQIIWGVNYYAKYISYSSRIIWDKKNDNTPFSQCEIASYSKGVKVYIFRYKWNGMLQENMKNKETRIHPTQKPVALYKWLLKNYAKPGDKLLDTHSGSGSFRIAAHDLGFDLVSCELDPDYCRDNEARFQQHIQQIDLFKPEEIQEKIFTEGKLF